MNTKKLITVMAILGVTMLTSTSALATLYGTVNVKIGMDFYLNMASMIQPYDTSWYTGPTGRYKFTYSNMNPPEMDLLPYAFCIETQTVSLSRTYPYSVMDAYDAPQPLGPDVNEGPMGYQKAEYLEELWGRFYDDVNNNITAAAFALTVYEIVFEDLNPSAWDVTTGKFSARDDGGNISLAIGQANNWLGQIDGSGIKTPLHSLINLSHQDYIVPEPATICLLAIGSLAFIGRKKIVARRNLASCHISGRKGVCRPDSNVIPAKAGKSMWV